MELEITLDHEQERVTVLFDNCMLLTASNNSSGKVVFSRNFNDLEDEEVQRVLQKICELLLSMQNA